jgi:hypothetical protein
MKVTIEFDSSDEQSIKSKLKMLIALRRLTGYGLREASDEVILGVLMKEMIEAKMR